MIESALLGALCGSITGPLALLALRAWERRKYRLRVFGDPPLARSWTERPIAKGRS